MARLYTRHSATEPHEMFAYGDPWVCMALFCDDLKFLTPAEAKEWWEKFLEEHPDYESEGNTDVFYGNETEDF